MFIAIGLLSKRGCPGRVFDVDDFYDSVVGCDGNPFPVGGEGNIAGGESGSDEKLVEGGLGGRVAGDSAIFGGDDYVFIGSAKTGIIIGSRVNSLRFVLGAVAVFSDEVVGTNSVDELAVWGVSNEGFSGGVCKIRYVRLRDWIN